MIEGQGLFQLAARSAAYAALGSNKAALHGHAHNVFEKSDKPSPLSHLTVDANTTIRAMFQAAWDKVHADDNLISDENLKRLEKASKSDNKEIAAERLRQAKAKLRSLRLQAQIAAASGDAKALKRIAQQAAQAAREVAGAARGLADGIVAGAHADATSDGPASASVPLATSGTGDNAEQAPTSAVPSESDTLGNAREELRQLGDETRAAIAQAKGLIAFAALAARMKRNQRPDPGEDSDYRALQQSANEAGQDLDATLNAAWQSLQSDTAGGGGTADSAGDAAMDSVSAVTTMAVFVQVTTEVTITANLVV